MKKQIIGVCLVFGLCSMAVAENLDLNTNDLNIERLEMSLLPDVNAQNITNQEKQRLLKEKIDFLKKDIQKWEKYHEELLNVKKEYDASYLANEEKIKQLTAEISIIKEKIATSGKDIDDKSNDIDVAKKLMTKENEIVEYTLGNGKKIKLIKYTIFPGESLDDIVEGTFKDNEDFGIKDVAFRKQTIIKLNNNINEKDDLVSGQVIYIPFFKK